MLILVAPQVSKLMSTNCSVNACGLECVRLVCGINRK